MEKLASNINFDNLNVKGLLNKSELKVDCTSGPIFENIQIINYQINQKHK